MSVTWSSTDKGAAITVGSTTNGANFRVTSDGVGAVRATTGKTSGKWYWEVIVSGVGSGITIGVASSLANINTYTGADSQGWGYYNNGGILHSSGTSGSQDPYFFNLIGVALDMDNKTVQFYKEGVATGALVTGLESTMYASIGAGSAGINTDTNFGATTFTFTPPAGFTAYNVDGNAQPVATNAWSPTDKGTSVTLSNSNLTAGFSATGMVRSTVFKTEGKWYWEFTPLDVSGGLDVGVTGPTSSLETYVGISGQPNDSWGYWSYGYFLNQVTTVTALTYQVGDTIGVALDMDNKTVQYYKNSIAAGQLITGLGNKIYAAASTVSSGAGLVSVNFGATPFVYGPPSGFTQIAPVASNVNVYKPIVHLGKGVFGDRTQDMVLALTSADIQSALGYIPTGLQDAPTTIFPADDDFNYGTSVDTVGARSPGAIPWITGYKTSDTRVISQGHLIWTIPQETTSDGNMRALWQTLPTGDWQYRTKISFWIPPGELGSFSNYSFAGIAVRNSTTGKLVDFHRIMEGDSARNIQVNRWDNNGTNYINSVVTNSSYLSKYDIPFTGLIYLDIEKVGTNLLFSMSGSGLPGSFILVGTEALDAHLGTIDQIGIDMQRSVSSYPTSVGYDWFRRIK